MIKEDVVGKINYDDVHFPKEDAENALFESFVTFEQSKRLNALGFKLLNPRFFYNEFGDFSGFTILMSCTSPYPYYQAPTLAQACKWLRSKRLSVQVYLNGVRTAYFARVWQIVANGEVCEVASQFDTYEQAQSAGIDVALDMLEKGGEE